MTDTTFSFRVDEALKSAFESSAKARGQTSAQLLRDFMRSVVQEQRDSDTYLAWFCREVKSGISEAEAGDVIPQADVEARFVARRNALRRSLGIFE